MFHSIRNISSFFSLTVLLFIVSGCNSRKVKIEDDAKDLKESSYSSNLKFIQIRKAIVYLAESIPDYYRHQLPSNSKVQTEQNVAYTIGDDFESSLYYPIKGDKLSKNELIKIRETQKLDQLFFGKLEEINQNVSMFYMDKSGLIRGYPSIDLIGNFGQDYDLRNKRYFDFNVNQPNWKWFFEGLNSDFGSGTKIFISYPVVSNNKIEGVVGLSISEETLLQEIIETGDHLQLLCNNKGKIIVGHPDAYKILGISYYKNKNDYVFKSKNESVREAMKVLFLDEKQKAKFKLNNKSITIMASEINEIDAKLIRLISIN